MSRYAVMVDDNFHFMDESERWCAGQYETAEEAIGHAAAIVRGFFEDADPNEGASELYLTWEMFGEDPFVVPLNGAPPVEFSACGYARHVVTEICRRK